MDTHYICDCCKEEEAEYEVGGGVHLCKKCYETWLFNVFQQMEDLGLL